MKSALEVLKIREDKKQQRIKENQEQINKELFAFEKSLNKYENNILDEKPYITVDEIIKTEEVKSLLKQNGYIIDKVSNDIEYGTTRIFLDEKEYEAVLKLNYLDKKMKENHDVKIKLEPTTRNYNKSGVENLFKELGWI